jgi:hypothetical protein
MKIRNFQMEPLLITNLKTHIKNELLNNFESIDEDILSYILSE